MKCVRVETPEYMRAHIFPERRIARGKRAARHQATKEVQAKYNAKMAQNKLTDLIENNFTPEGWTIHPTYDAANLPEDEAGAMKCFAKWVRKLRALIKSRGADPAELKYINILQHGRRSDRLHHHVIIEGPTLTLEDLENSWVYGVSNPHHLKFAESGVEGLSRYLMRGSALFKRWTCSRNLKRPEPYDHGPNELRRAEVEYINEHPEDRERIEKMFPGWRVAAVETTPDTVPDKFGLFVVIHLYREDNRYFTRDRNGFIHYGLRPERTER